jgi:hypothetical protein
VLWSRSVRPAGELIDDVTGQVKGRVETSAPILRRAGFRGYGEERSYRLALDGGTGRISGHRRPGAEPAAGQTVRPAP